MTDRRCTASHPCPSCCSGFDCGRWRDVEVLTVTAYMAQDVDDRLVDVYQDEGGEA